MTWYEVRLRKGALPYDFYDSFTKEDTAKWQTYHHYRDEPWWPGGYVVRIRVDDDVALSLSTRSDFDHVVVWDAEPDEEAFGAAWPSVAKFFQSASKLSCYQFEGDDWQRFHSKLIHCYLNAQGMDYDDEVRFHLRLAWNRAKMVWRERRLSPGAP